MSYASQLPSFSADSHMLCQAASLRAYLTWRWNQAGRSFQLGVWDGSQVEPFRAEPSEGRADRINVCVCVCVGDSVSDSVSKRVREGSTVYLPQHINNKKKVCENEGFCRTYWATIARLWAEGKSKNCVTSLSVRWQRKRLCFMTSWQCQCNCTAATKCLSFFRL